MSSGTMLRSTVRRDYRLKQKRRDWLLPRLSKLPFTVKARPDLASSRRAVVFEVSRPDRLMLIELKVTFSSRSGNRIIYYRLYRDSTPGDQAEICSESGIAFTSWGLEFTYQKLVDQLWNYLATPTMKIAASRRRTPGSQLPGQFGSKVRRA